MLVIEAGGIPGRSFRVLRHTAIFSGLPDNGGRFRHTG